MKICTEVHIQVDQVSFLQYIILNSQVDETEPPPKKTEHTRSNSDGALKKPKAVTNGRRKNTETSESEGEEKKEKKDKIIDDGEGKKEKIIDKGKGKKDKKDKIQEKGKRDKTIGQFDSEEKSKCVSAFKESDSWD